MDLVDHLNGYLRPTPTRPTAVWHSREIRTLEVTPYDPGKGTLALRLGGPPQRDGAAFVYCPPGLREAPPGVRSPTGRRGNDG